MCDILSGTVPVRVLKSKESWSALYRSMRREEEAQTTPLQPLQTWRASCSRNACRLIAIRKKPMTLGLSVVVAVAQLGDKILPAVCLKPLTCAICDYECFKFRLHTLQSISALSLHSVRTQGQWVALRALSGSLGMKSTARYRLSGSLSTITTSKWNLNQATGR